jgi:RNA polymerase sigma-70 factor (ECF subfamily)
MTPSLVIRLRDGQSDAGQMLDQLYRERLTRFCVGYMGNRDEAEDVVQDAFYRVLCSTAVPDNFRAWIYEICRNRCIDRLRAKNRRLEDQPLATYPHIAAHMTGTLTRLLKGEQRNQLWKRLATLPADQREVLLLRYTEGLSRVEISTVLSIPEKLVKSRIFNGLNTLRKHDSLAEDR